MRRTTQIQIADTGALGDSAHLQKAMEAVPGVQSARVETQLGRATIEHEGADGQKLLAAIKAAGHEAKLIPNG